MPISLIGDLLTGLFGVVDKAVVDKDKVREMQHDLALIVHQSALAQLAVNRQEAAHKSLFVAGWRPFVGWVCGLALFYKFLGQPLLIFGLVFVEVPIDADLLPDIGVEALYPILLGMLGLGGLRSYEKLKGVSREK